MIARLQNEFQEITEALEDGSEEMIDKDILAVFMEENNAIQNVKTWFCIFRGKENTSLQGGNYKLKIQFGQNYPFEPPQVWILDGFRHYHVFLGGKICYKLLNKQQWKLSFTISKLLNGIIKMLHSEPEINDPAANDLPLSWFGKQKSEENTFTSLSSKLSKYYAFLREQSLLFHNCYSSQIQKFQLRTTFQD